MNRYVMPLSYLGLGFRLRPFEGATKSDDPLDTRPTALSTLSEWCCNLSAQSGERGLPENFVFGVVNTHKWRKGILIRLSQIPEETIKAYSRSAPFLPTRTINLDDWSDPVTEALKNIDLFEEEKEGMAVTDGTKGYSYDFDFRTMSCRGSFQWETPVRSSDLDPLSMALLRSLQYFATLYDDETIRSAVLKLQDL
ncbi:MAG: hypothetical protein MUF87_20380 [Anaerolineae bacterium]|nr:hypothetical protein [Anaerolineae bacterium]